MSNIDEKRLFEVKRRIAGIVQSAALFGADAGQGRAASFSGGDVADLIDELVIMRIKQALATDLQPSDPGTNSGSSKAQT